jgi:dolichyl-phosphate beta-glucosyltransferase
VASSDTRLRILNFSPNHGKGFAVRQGVLAAQGEWVLFMDADLATSLLEISKFWQHRQLASVLIGSRYLRKNSIIQLQPWYRRLASRLGNLVIQLVLLPGLSDTQCGFKMFSRQAATAIFTRSIQNGWSFDVEILAIARQLGLSSVELPVEWSDQPNSRISIVSDSLRLLVDLYKIKSYLSRLPR